jgi:phenylacetate-CoA ligase
MHAQFCCLSCRNQWLKKASTLERDLKLKIGMFGAEPWSNQIRERLEKETGISAFDIFMG